MEKDPGAKGVYVCICMHVCACVCTGMSVGTTHNKIFGTRNGTGTESKNRKKRNRSQGWKTSPILCVVHHAACMWVYSRLVCVRQPVGGVQQQGTGGWTGRFDGGSLMPKQSKILRLYPCLQASHGPSTPPLLSLACPNPTQTQTFRSSPSSPSLVQ